MKRLEIRGSLVGLVFAATLGALGLGGCGSDDEGEPTAKKGGAVGAACDTSAQCTGYDKPSCVKELKPLAGKITDPSHPAAPDFEAMALPFPGGYCTTSIVDSCGADGECGAGAGCFRAFEGVPQTTIDAFAMLDPPLPFNIQEFSNLGICLKSCADNSECRAADGYTCIVPLRGLMPAFNPTYMKKFCLQDKDYSSLVQ